MSSVTSSTRRGLLDRLQRRDAFELRRRRSFDTYRTDAAARQAGFITRYSSKAPDEDFVEQLSLYVTSTAAEWEAILAQGGSAGRPLLEQKNDIMRAYMLSTWDINIDELRKVVLRRQNEIWSLDYNI